MFESDNKVHVSRLVICLLLILITTIAYWQLGSHDFVNYDDNEYVTENHYVRGGLKPDGVVWAFQSTHAGNWHPLTWLSHMVDCHVFGLDAGRHHLTSVFFHIANTLLAFLVLAKMTGKVWRSAFVAAMFAIHPLHVESVAWISERKDVLSTFFLMLAIWAYSRYVEQATIKKYLVVIISFILGLMAKPMLVTLPLLLFLLDYWPLGRLRAGNDINSWRDSFDVRLLLEKVPLFVLSAISCVVTYIAQRSGGAVAPFLEYSARARIANAFVAYIGYIEKMFWPVRLAVFYPYPAPTPWGRAAVSLLLILLIFAFSFRNFRKAPYLIVGWLWYVITLLPVIGLIQVGGQAMADRYTYVPLLGIFIIIAWGVPSLVGGRRNAGIALEVAASVLIASLILVSRIQVGYWKDSATLFKHALEVTKDNYMAHTNLGVALKEAGDVDEAVSHYIEAVRIAPDFAKARYNLGNAMSEQGRFDDAINQYFEALKSNSDWPQLHNNLGVAFAQTGRLDEAVRHYSMAISLEPCYIEARHNLGLVLKAQGRIDEAITNYLEGLSCEPASAQMHNDIALALASQGKLDEAIQYYRKAVQLEPDWAQARNNLGVALAMQGRLDEAIEQYQQALRISPGHIQALLNLAAAFDSMGEYEKAISVYEGMIKFYPENHVAYCNIARIYSKLNRVQESIDWLQKSIELGFRDMESIKTDKDWENARNSYLYQVLVAKSRED